MGPQQPTCRFCGHVNVAGAGRCESCHRPLESDSSTAQLGSVDDTEAPTAAGTPSHWLCAEQGSLAGQRFAIAAPGISVGRVAHINQITIEDSAVSRIHAHLHVEGDQVVLEDHSANGTFVNDHRVQRIQLRPGDRIRFGPHSESVFAYDPGNAPAGASVPARAGEPSGHRPGPARTQPPVSTIRVRPEDETAISDHGSFQLVLDQYAVENLPITAARVKLGRAPGAGVIQIDHPTVAETHAEVFASLREGVRVRDLNSPTGTFVNGERIQERTLQEGDILQLGDCRSRLLLFRESRKRVLVLRDLELNKPVVTLGRDPGSDIRLDHPTVSRVHAEVRRRDGGFEIIDRASNNGTFVNGLRIRRHALRRQDRITLGAVQMVFDGAHLEEQSDGTRVRLMARRLSRVVPDEHTHRPLKLLDDVSLVIEPREFVGLLGPGGSGKTTLLHALNGFQPADQGRVMFNNWSLYKHFDSLRSGIGYVPQEDIVHRGLSVRECLYYAGRLRLPDDYSEREIWERVSAVLRALELEPRADLASGELSGGQRKRLSVAIELLSRPSLLFLDEPTAGQDPRTEMQMMEMFREIANRGSTVVMTTHLLGSFSLLDKVAVVLQGHVVYFGPGPEMLRYFGSSRPHEIYDRLRSRPPEEWTRRYRESELHREMLGRPLGEERPPDMNASLQRAVTPAAAGRSRVRQLATLVSRQLTAKGKDWKDIAGLLLPPAGVALLVALITSAPNQPRTLLMIIFSGLWFGCSASVREIVDEAALYRRERHAGLGILSYLGSKLFYLAGLAVLQSGIFLLILTLMDAQTNHFLAAWGLMTLITLQGALLGLVISALARNSAQAMYIFPLALIPQLLLAGLLIPMESRHPFSVVKLGETQNCTAAKAAALGYCLEDAPRWTLQEQMPAVLRYGPASAMVSRWGLEQLSDLYAHDFQEDAGNLESYRYSFENLGAVSVTAHPGDEAQARKTVEDLISGRITPTQVAAAPREDSAPFYLGIQFAFAAGMLGVTAALLKQKDRRSSR